MFCFELLSQCQLKRTGSDARGIISSAVRRDVAFSGTAHGSESFDRIMLMHCSEGKNLVSLPRSEERLHEDKRNRICMVILMFVEWAAQDDIGTSDRAKQKKKEIRDVRLLPPHSYFTQVRTRVPMYSVLCL